MYGYAGKILRISLDEGKIKEEKLSKKLVKEYLGGVGLATKILYDELKPKINPLSKENKLIFSIGPLVGTSAPSSGRHVIASKSPLTGLWGHSLAGGFFGAELKFAGYDMLIIEGASISPVYLLITSDEVEINDASHIWGKDVFKTTEILQKKVKGARVACIGPAGENLVKFASIMNDMYRAAGRTGMGAVMGSKKLKAIVVKGSKKPEIADPKLFNETVKEVRKRILSYSGSLSRRAYGTSGGLEYETEHLGNLPTKYFQEAIFKRAKIISGEHMAKTILKRKTSCFACPIGCGRYIEINSGKYAPIIGRGPEYETIAAFGSLCLCANLEFIAKANDLCNRLGIDTISCGSIIAFTIKCREKGLLKSDEFKQAVWGNENYIIGLIQKIGKRQGIGSLLAEGVKKFAENIGEKAEEIALNVKGLEIPMHDPRAQYGMGLQYATATRGAVHIPFTGYVEMYGRGIEDLNIPSNGYDRFSSKGKAHLVKTLQDLQSVYDSTILCMFAYPPCVPSVRVEHVVKMISSATGLELDISSLMTIGERIWNLQKLFNLREGTCEDTLPNLFTKHPHREGPCKERSVPLEHMLEEYYMLRGWSKEGNPENSKLKELGLATNWEN